MTEFWTPDYNHTADEGRQNTLVAFNRTAEIVRDYVKKGSQLLIEGKIQTRSWDDRETGQRKYRTEIFVYDPTLLGGGSEQNGNDNSYARSSASYAPVGRDPQEDYADQGITDGDIPF